MPPGLHPDLHGVSTDADVRTKIAAATVAMNGTAPSTHYARQMTAVDTPPPAPSSAANGGFTVLQFNLLAEGLSSGPPAVPPFDDASKTGTFGGFDAVPAPEVCLDFNLRKWRYVRCHGDP